MAPAPTEINSQEPGKRNGGVLFILTLMFLGNIGGVVYYFKSKREEDGH